MSTTPLPASAKDQDTSVYSLIFANVLTIAMAWIFSWPLAYLLAPYWIQSVIIGYFAQKRIRMLHQYSTANFQINNHSVEPTEQTKKQTANFFVMHYGVFHAAYFAFLTKSIADLATYDWIAVGVATISFVMNHRHSFKRNVEADVRGKPNIGTLMFLPYARIVPMHLTIILGSATHMKGAFALVLFGTLKTLADVLMHKVEHRLLQKEEAETAP